MLEFQSLGLEEARQAIAAGEDAAEKLGLPMAFAVTDVGAELIAATRMNGAHPRILRHAIRKAYTSATMCRNTLWFRRDLEDRVGSLDQWGDADLTTLPGGLVVKSKVGIVGAVGTGGGGKHDEEIAHIMVRAMGFEPLVDKRAAANRGG
jgi:uncharacterized protein GlcG (DUF336 family)